MTTITKEMTIAEVLRVDQELVPILLEHGMHCLGCPMASAESLEDASHAHGMEPDDLVNALNDFLAGKE